MTGEQILVFDDLPKPKEMHKPFKSIVGVTSLLSIEGKYWKKMRKMFNPAFAPSHLETLIPVMVDEAGVFVEKLSKVARTGETARMTEFTLVCIP